MEKDVELQDWEYLLSYLLMFLGRGKMPPHTQLAVIQDQSKWCNEVLKCMGVLTMIVFFKAWNFVLFANIGRGLLSPWRVGGSIPQGLISTLRIL